MSKYAFGVDVGGTSVKLGLFGAEGWEDVFPAVFFGRTIEGGEDEHHDLGSHADGQEGVAAGEVENLEEGAPDYDGCADGVGEVEEPLSFLG